MGICPKGTNRHLWPPVMVSRFVTPSLLGAGHAGPWMLWRITYYTIPFPVRSCPGCGPRLFFLRRLTDGGVLLQKFPLFFPFGFPFTADNSRAPEFTICPQTTGVQGMQDIVSYYRKRREISRHQQSVARKNARTKVRALHGQRARRYSTISS